MSSYGAGFSSGLLVEEQENLFSDSGLIFEIVCSNKSSIVVGKELLRFLRLLLAEILPLAHFFRFSLNVDKRRYGVIIIVQNVD